jgi:hypothetical protein
MPDADNALKILNTQRIIAQATPAQLAACIMGYSRMDNAAAAKIVQLARAEVTRRAEQS